MRWVRCRASLFKYLGEDALLLNTLDITRAKELEQLLLIKHKMASLGRVAAGIAHEIRNPLTGINSYVYTLKEIADAESIDPQDIPTLQQIARQIQVASNKIDGVIQRVLDFARPNIPRMVKIDVNQPVKAAIELTAVTLRKSGITLATQLNPDLPQCYADRHMIEQVILNMINNATRVMEGRDSAKKIEIASFTREEQVCISLADSGPGIPADLTEKIFDPFFTTHSDGSGIGLSIAQRIIADHNGKILVGSSRWGGAEFTIELPIEKRIAPR
jgi:signal transduction histidine kinase